MNELVTQNTGFMVINTLEDALKCADIIAKSSFCPKALAGKAGDVLVCMQMGQELGLKPLQSLQNIAVINGKPSVYGDALVAICRQCPDWEYMKEECINNVATCTVKRRNEPEIVCVFSEEDAKKARLWGKEGPWSSYPKRMLQMRARGFALRDAYPDLLRGMITAEEAGDYPKKDNSKIKGTTIEAKAETVPPPPDEDMPSFMQDKPVQLLSPEEVTMLADKMKQAGSDVGAICKHLKIASIHFIPKAKLPEMLGKLDGKIAAMNASKAEMKEFPLNANNCSSMNPEVAEFFEDEK
jgi:hypothetical protein